MAKSSGGTRYSHSNPSSDYKEYRAYSREWEKTYFDRDTGGFVVTDKERIESSNESKNDKAIFQKELEMNIDLARQGHKIEYLSDKGRRKGQTYDIHFDGKNADLKSVSSHNNIEKYVRHAFKNQGAKMVIVRIENKADKAKCLTKLHNAKSKYGRKILYYYESEKILREI